MLIPALAYRKPITADEWACNNVTLYETGRFSYAPTPFFELPTRCASDLTVHCRVVLSTPAQCGKTQTICNILGWLANNDAANTLLIMDSLKSCQKISKNRIKPFLRDQAGVLSLQAGSKVLDKSKDILNISLGCGANLVMGSSASASDLCSFPVKYLFMDELDRFCTDLKQEGNPVVLAFKRQLRFKGMAVLTSTPTTEDGNITTHFKLGTQEYWCAQCECGAWLKVEYKNINYENDTPTYTCEHCGIVHSESDIIKLKHGYAPPENDSPYKDNFGRVCRSFKVTAPLVHGIYTWDSIKKEERQAYALGESSVRSFYNTTLGECYHAAEEAVISEDALIKARRYFTRETLPSWVDVITIGVDTQDNRFEAVAIGSSIDGRKVAVIERRIFVGDLHTREPWQKLYSYLTTFKACTKASVALGESKTLYPAVVCIDSGGHFTQDVYAFCVENRRFRAVKGRSFSMDTQETSLIAAVNEVALRALGTGVGRVTLTHVNTRFAKDIIHTQLLYIQKTPTRSNWILSAAEDANIDSTFMQQMNSEYKEITKGGRVKWVPKQGVRNEVLDCLVYALAAVEIVRLHKGLTPMRQAIKESTLTDNNNNYDNLAGDLHDINGGIPVLNAGIAEGGKVDNVQSESANNTIKPPPNKRAFKRL